MDATNITTEVSRPNPYIGPRPYREGETIYGREREISELLDLLIAERIILLYSPSGAGKSSLLNAAIIPQMTQQGFQVFPTIRLNLEPPPDAELADDFNRYVYSCLQSIEEGLPENQRFPVDELVKLKFKDYLKKYHKRAASLNPDGQDDAPVLMVFDQAEEVIRISITDRPKKLDFFVQLGDVLRDRNIWAVVAMREDYLATFDPYMRPIPTRFANRYRLSLLDAQAAAQAIQRPAQSAGVEFLDESASQLVDDLRAVTIQQPDGSTAQELGPTVEPVQLQVVCRRLWTKLPNTADVVTVEDVKALGNVNRALADYYALQTASVANMAHIPEREIREWFQRKLITASGIRGQVLMTVNESEGLDNKAIWMLERTYLIRAEKRGGATWFELAHDRLVSPVRENNEEWFNKHLNVLQRRADLWAQQDRPDSLLLVGSEFLEMEVWVKNNAKIITQVEKDFYHESQIARQRVIRERRVNMLVRWLFVASVISTIVAIGFYIRSHIAEENAQARELAAASLSNLQSDPERSTLLALEGLHVTTLPHPEIIQALHQALPAMRIARTSSPQEGHIGNVYTVVYSPDGKTIASAGKDGNIIIWDALNLTVIQTLLLVPDRSQYNGYGAFAAVYSPDGKFLAAVGADGKLTVFDTSTWEIEYQIEAHKGQVRAVAYSHNGKYIATGGGDSTARVWDATTGKLIASLGGVGKEGNQYGIETVTFNLDDTILFVGGDSDLVIYAWDVASGTLAYQLGTPGKTINLINGLAVSPDGKTLASSGSDRLIRLWELDSRGENMEIPGHVDWVYGLAFTPDGQRLISAGADRTIRVWDTQYGRSQMVLAGPTDQVFDVAVSPDGRYVASGSGDGYVRLWDISPQGSSEVITMDHKGSVHDVIYSPDGKMIASAGNADGVIKLWDASTGALLRTLQGIPPSAESMFWNSNGRYLAASYGTGQALVWDMTNTAADAQPVLTIQGNGVWVNGVSLNADSSMLATADDNGMVHVYNTKNGREVINLNADKQFGWSNDSTYNKNFLWASAALFSPDGKYVAASYATGMIVIWDWMTGKPAMVLKGHDDIVENIAYNPDGSLLASASDDSNVIIWDLDPKLKDSERVKATLTGHRALVYDVSFSPNGALLVSGGGDGVIKVWEVGTVAADDDTPLVNLYGNTNRVHSVVFSPDNRHIASGSTDHTVRVFTLDDNELVKLAHGRVTRQLSGTECDEFFNMSCENFKQYDQIKPITDFFNHFFHW